MAVTSFLSMPAICAAPEAVLHASAGATLDGEAALDGMRVFSGQTLRTENSRVSELFLSGNTIRILPDSNVKYLGDSLDLLAGGVTLTTSTRFPIRSQCVTVTPLSSTSAHYTVQIVAKKVFVAAESGAITVKALREVRIASPKTATIDCASPAQDIIVPASHFAVKAAAGAAIAAAPIAGLSHSGSKQEMSPPSTSHR